MQSWRTYDEIAEVYERVHAPRFAEVARDLVAMAGVEAGLLVLDVGTGTGVAAQAAADSGARVVGVDVAVPMLLVGRRARPTPAFAAAEAIDLPFRDGTFDAVTANFVIGHFRKYRTALFDMARVLRPGGRIAVSSWADGRDNLQETWFELAASVAPAAVLRSAVADAYPWGERFTSRERVVEALHDAGSREVRAERREYLFRYTLDEYVDGLATFTIGRFLRDMLGPERWASFLERARTVFAERFADPLNDFREAWLAVGTKP